MTLRRTAWFRTVVTVWEVLEEGSGEAWVAHSLTKAGLNSRALERWGQTNDTRAHHYQQWKWQRRCWRENKFTMAGKSRTMSTNCLCPVGVTLRLLVTVTLSQPNSMYFPTNTMSVHQSSNDGVVHVYDFCPFWLSVKTCGGYSISSLVVSAKQKSVLVAWI